MTKSGKSMFRIEFDEEEKRIKAFTRSSKGLYFANEKGFILKVSTTAMKISISLLRPLRIAYIYPSQRKTSLRLATTNNNSNMPIPIYSAHIMKFSDGLRRVIIS